MQIDDRRLPVAVESSATWRLTFMTHKTVGYGGKPSRFAKRIPLWEATLSVGPNDFDDVHSLLREEIGGRYTLRVRHPMDYIATDEPLTQDDDGNWPLTITYGTGARTRVRRIFAPVVGTISVKVDGSLTSNSNWTLGAGGLITPIASPDQGWDASPAPEITASFQFDTPMALADDGADLTVVVQRTDPTDGLAMWKSLRFLEVPQ